MSKYAYQLIAVNQSLYDDVKIIFEIRSEAGFTFKLPALEVAENPILLAQMSPEDVKRVEYFASVLKPCKKNI